MSLSLCYYGNPVLRKTAEPVTEFTEEVKILAQDMVSTMRAESGIGLAGPQIGKSLRIFVMEVPPEMDVDEAGDPLNPGLDCPLVAVNPEIEVIVDDRDEMEEGCLSIPDVRGRVERPTEIRMTYQTVTGDSTTRTLKGLAARCAQHEFDHLNGVLFLDHLGSVKRMAIKGKLKKIKQAYNS
jgi:peptide deformylase